VDNLTEEFYQSLMSGYRMIEDLGRQDCRQKPNGRQTPCKQPPFSGSGRWLLQSLLTRENPFQILAPPPIKSSGVDLHRGQEKGGRCINRFH
jgi:hypothetical protein